MTDGRNDLTRRQFGHHIIAAWIATGLSVRPTALRALVAPVGAMHYREAKQLQTIDLEVNYSGVAIPRAKREAVTINGELPAPLLRLREGQDVAINVTNRLDEDTSIHWHGLLVPANMDGVPGFSFPGIRPGETFTYRFRVRQSGTYWYHSHSEGQEQQGMYGPIVIEPAAAIAATHEREYVVLLSEWSNEHPHKILRNLKGDPGYYNYGKRTLPGFFRDLFRAPGATLRDREMWGRMRMDPTDIADVSAATYTYLMNGQSAEQNWLAEFDTGERVRLRLINAGAMTYFDVRIPGLKMTVIQADGQDIQPVTVDEIRIAVAETYDVIVEPGAGRAYTIFAQSLDRSGYVRGTLGSKLGDSAAIPAMDRRPLRSMSMSTGHDHAAMTEPPVVDHAAMGHGVSDTETRKTLSYSDLIALVPNSDVRAPETDIMLRLTGDMERYFWTINERKLDEADPIRLRVGQRVRLHIMNETMMEHPMHLHGVFMELQNGQGPALAPRKHTISVPPFEMVEAHLTFDEPGHWALHCHLMYHMMTGMFVRVIVEPRVSEQREDNR